MRTTLSSLLVLLAFAVFAQPIPEIKIGYADPGFILSKMPEAKQIESDLKAHGDQLQAQMKLKYAEYEAKLAAYQKGASTMVDAVRQDKEAELTGMQSSFQKFQQDAEQSFQKKQSDLMTPIYTRIGKAIGEVAKELGYTYILNPTMPNGDDVLLYHDDQFDISSQVLRKLGVTVVAPAKPQPK